MKAIVVAMDKNNGIGADNDLLWQRDLPADLAHFKELTTGKTIVMGRKTFESIGRALPNRENIVVSRQPLRYENVIHAASIDEAYDLASNDVCVIGGGQIYTQALEDMDILYVTEVDAEFAQASVFFPEINEQQWRETSREHHDADERNKYSFDFVVYERVH
ncbi:MAG TPA: dihydrofolate reductase [Candidatus Saccharibacteria bacterium]|nr:dihydrofolate reductase [Candidatus Saccharibacteria bacterium]